MLKSKPSFSDRLLRYSAVASIVTSGTLIARTLPVTADTIVDHTMVSGDPMFPIDMDNNGTPELWFNIESSSSYIAMRSFAQSISFMAVTGNTGWMYVDALVQGTTISTSTGTWRPGVAYATLTKSGSYGYWVDLPSSRYVGVRFVDDTLTTRYGWIEVTVVDIRPGPVSLTIHRFGTTTESSIPAAVELAGVSAASGLQTLAASAFAALGGALTWIRRKLRA